MARNDLIVIGAGTSGYVVAVGALRLGWGHVMLIDKNENIGGAALHASCVPSKLFIHIAKVAHSAQHAVQYGLDSYLLNADFGKITKYIDSQVQELANREMIEAQTTFRQLGGKIVQGKARFIDPNTVEVANQRVSASNIVIATGSRPLYPEIKGIDEIGYVTNETVFSIATLPERLVILGNKPSAIEFAQAFARLGSKVSIIVANDSILPHEDPELVDKLKHILMEEGVEIHVNSRVLEAYAHKDKKVLECIHDGGQVFVINADAVLVVEGRRPNIEELALESAGVQYAKGGILVNGQLLTSQKHIYAVGDVTASPYKLTHAAEYQANVVLSNMVLKQSTKTQYQGFPYVIFTDPEYAQTGLSEQQAINKGFKDIEVTRFDFKDLDSAYIKNSTEGRIKVISRNNKVIGASILGPDAGNLLSEWSLAIKVGASVADIASTIHPYPTLAQVNRRAANKCLLRMAQGRRATSAWVQRVLSWA